MKKIAIYIVLIILSFSCENVLDLKPLTQISEEDVWQDATLMRSLLTDIYASLPENVFNAESHPDRWTDLATHCLGNRASMPLGEMSKTNDPMSYWNYTGIRDLNIFLERLPDALILESEKKQMEGEVRAMRALIYFMMQQRYGGVPLVDIVIDPFSEIDKKYTQRSTEEAIADFIDTELESAVALLTEDISKPGAFNKWSAYTLKARANLWSASIAKYGTVQINGLVGIPSARADEFFTKASSAANMVILSGKYSLYDKYANKATNYQKLFIDQNNPEVIWRVSFNGTTVRHAGKEWNGQMKPSSWAGSSRQIPTLDFILGFENIDGSENQPDFGPEHLYDSSYAPFANKDPRLRGTVFFDKDIFVDALHVVDSYEGIDPSIIPDVTKILSTYGDTYNGMPVVGDDSRLFPIDDYSTTTGFTFKKYLWPAFDPDPSIGSNDFWVFRLGEVYLIRAEAEFELENFGPAADALNATRQRAGISLVDETSITFKHIQTERRSELALETGFRWWDLRRWRIAEEVLNGRTMQGLRIIRHYVTSKYYFIPIPCESFSRVFRPEHYYNPITNAEIDKNPDLVENPLY